jgi:hypothetical protein
VIKKNGKVSIKNLNSSPWKVADKTLGLHSEHDLLPSQLEKFESHHIYELHGMRYQFHSPFEIPSSTNTKFISKAWSITNFEIDVDITKLGDNLMDYGVEKSDFFKINMKVKITIFRRNCFFENENPLEFFKIYTENNCIQECYSTFTLKTCGCVRFYMIRSQSTKICGHLERNCYKKAEKKFETASCKCLPDCNLMEYIVEEKSKNFAK